MKIDRNRTTATTIALVLMLAFSALFAAVPFVNAQDWNIYIAVTSTTGLVRIEVRLGTTRQLVPFTGISFGYLPPGGTWQNITGLSTQDGRVDYYLGTLVTAGVWHFQARVPAQSPLPKNPATPDGSWYSADLTVTVPVYTPLKFDSFLLVSAAPNPAGVGQPLYVNAFFSKPFTGTASDRYYGLEVWITRPDGKNETFGPYYTDATGGTWFTYTPAIAGNYTVQGYFPGQDFRYHLTGTGSLIPFGKYKIITDSYIVTYLPSYSSKLIITVQEEPVPPAAQPPLPTEYWSRPITATNWDWGALEGSNWWGLNSPSFTDLGGYDATGNVQPYGKAPNSPHIMWTKSTTMGGQPGGSITSDMEGQFTSTSILNRHWEPIIIYGLNIYQTWNNAGEAGSGFENPERWIAVDIRTGETVWQRTRGITGGETLRGAWIQKFHSIQEYGSWGALFATGAGSMGYLYDPFTGEHMSNVTDVSWGSAIIDTHPGSYKNAGAMLRYYVTAGNLTCWNSTRIWGASPGAGGQRNWTTGVQWSFNVTATYGADMPTGVRVMSTDVILLQTVPRILSGAYVYESRGYMTVGAVDARTGEKLWGPKNFTGMPYTHDISMYGAREGVFTLFDKDTMECYAFSVKDGTKLWGPVSIADYTNAFDYIEMDTEVYMGVVVFWGFGGNVVGFNATTGAIMWHWTRGPSGYETPHGVYPLWDFGSESFADGKIFLSEGSMYDVPLHPARRVAINVTTGELVWSILSYSGRAPGAIADGYLLEWNSLSNEIVCFGKGPTATTVSASPKVSVHDNSVLVEGMVTDISPGTKAYNREARFPHGVPAVSEESQREWMEYVYMQQSRPTNATGVEVTLDTLDPNGNFVHIGTVTTDSSGMYKKAFVPEVPGEYTIIATFAGSESYWASYAETAINVEEAAPATTPPPQYPVPVDSTLTIIAAAIAIIIAVAIATILILRKK